MFIDTRNVSKKCYEKPLVVCVLRGNACLKCSLAHGSDEIVGNAVHEVATHIYYHVAWRSQKSFNDWLRYG